MTKLAPEWVRTSDPVIRSPARYRWTTAPASTLYQEDIAIRSLNICGYSVFIAVCVHSLFLVVSLSSQHGQCRVPVQ